jgi:UDP-N-acetylglucosamine/UDP-N-acetylgalactosamine diphosphorylase
MEVDSAIKQRLANANQEHLLAFWSELDDEQRQTLLNDINEVDFDRVTKAFDGVKQELYADTSIPISERMGLNIKEEVKLENIDELMEPVPDSITGSINETTEEQLESYRQKGQI